MNHYLKNLLLLSVSIGGCLIAFEIGIRLFLPQRFEPSYPNVYQTHPRLGHVMRPYAEGIYRTREFETEIKTNGDGFRDRDYGQKSDGVYRILCIGDSFTLGAEVDQDEVYPKVLERLLNAHKTGHYEVLNMGVRAYGTEQEVQLLQEAGLDYKPDLVVFQLYIANDLYENPPRAVPPYKVVDGFVVPVEETDAGDTASVETARAPADTAREETYTPAENRLPIPFKYWLAEHSELYVFLRARYHLLRQRWQERSRTGTENGPDGPDAAAAPDAQWVSWMEPAVRPYARVYDDDMRARWVYVDSLMAELKTLADQRRFRVALINAPLRERLDEDVFEAWGFEGHAYDAFKPDSLLQEMADARGFVMVPLYSAFSEAARQDDDLYWLVDGHWTAAGHRLVARAVYEALEQAGVLPGRDR